MPKITLVADESYHGTDNGKPLDMQPGDSADVSDAKAAQLFEDFPDRFKKGGGRRRAAAADKTPVDPPAATYAELGGDALRELAASRGVTFTDDADDASIRAALVADDEAAADAS
jgi:hypothetical protein